MARPKKFRHPLEALSQPNVAKQLAGYVAEIETFKAKVDELQQHIAEIYDDLDNEGFEKAAVRKLVADRAKPADQRERAEETSAAYEHAAEIGFSSRAREENARQAA